MLVGTKLGAYDVIAKLGEGGMGEVYRARDSRLGRDVAIKALPSSSTADPDRLARFRREAQILAGLTHPHIAALYGLEESSADEQKFFLVMELVEGGTLADRIRSGPVPLRVAVTVAREIADALQSAHDRGIIHRDLKPANIAFTADGHAKILDFGLAKTFTVSGDAATVATAATQSGLVLGTAAYMSPEQARGLPLDKRTDIFAFGCVLYEMLTASNPFGAATVSDTIVAILGREPDWTLLPGATPARVQWLLRRCLEKDPRRRLHDIADARIELEEALAHPAESGAAAGPPGAARPPRREVAAWAIALLSLGGLVGMLTFRGIPGMRQDVDDRVYRASIELPKASLFMGEPTPRFALSPDGRKIVFAGSSPAGFTMLWVRPLDSSVAQPVAGTEGGTFPFWSADSRSVGFIWRPMTETATIGGKLKQVDVTGGEPVTLADIGFSSLGAWNRTGVILFTPTGNSPLQQVNAAGGQVSDATTLDSANGEVQHAYPFFLPDGRHFLYTVLGSRTGGATTPQGVYVGSLDRQEPPRRLVEGASQAAYAAGYVFFLQGPMLMAQRFDPDRLVVHGSPIAVAERVQTASSGGGLAGAYSVSTSGLLLFQTSSHTRSQLAWFDRTGKPLGVLGEEADWVDVVLSPDGQRLATSMIDPAAANRDIWILDVNRGFAERFTSGAADDFAPVWSPRGDRLIFSSARQGRIDLFRKTQSAEPEERIADDGLSLGKYAAHSSPDGASILFIAGGRSIGRSDLMLLPVDGGTPRAFLDSSLVETQARFSPDGRWIAYASNGSGRLEVYVQPYGRAGAPKRISASGGRWPLWRRDSKELIFVSADNKLMAAAVSVTSDAVSVGDIRPLFEVKLRPQVRLDAYPYDMTPDGQRFIVNTFVDEPSASSPLTLIVNWPAALNK